VSKQNKTSVVFNKEVLSIIKELTPISDHIILTKDIDDKGEPTGTVFISQTNESESLGFIIRIPNNMITFEGDKLAFQEFSEFYQLYSLFEKEPEIEQLDASKIVMKGGSTKISVIIGEADVLEAGPDAINIGEPDAVLNITAAQLLELRKKIGLIKAEKVDLMVKKDNISLRFFQDENNNNIEEIFETKSKKDFHFITNANMFVDVPKADYTININKVGMIEMIHSTKIVDLRIYTGEVED